MTVEVCPADGARVVGPGTTVRVVGGDDADALALFARQQAELADRYGEPDAGSFDAAGLLAVLVVHEDGVAVACVALRDVSGTPDGRGGHHEPSTGEVKRLFVAPGHRGRGHARAVMRAAHEHAAASGLRHLVLETGTRQPESIDLYLGLGYRPIESYGHYAGDALSRCFAIDLPAPGGALPGPDGGRPAGPLGDAAPASAVETRDTPWDDPVAVGLRREMHETSSLVLYPELAPGFDAAGGFGPVDARLGEDVVATVVAWRDGEPVGCASLQRVAEGARVVHGDALEVKKVFVREQARRGGVARALLAAVEREARRRGAPVLLLETGFRQPGAIALYRSLGFRSVLPYPPYDDSPLGIALCFAKSLD